jgi:hypothetical protein
LTKWEYFVKFGKKEQTLLHLYNVEIRGKYIKPYYCINPSAFKLTQLLSVQNVKELNNLGKYLFVAEKIRNS